MTTWLITGCSSGLGRHLARAVLDAGFNAVVTARDPTTVRDIVAAYPKTALAAALDVTDETMVESVVGLAEERFGDGRLQMSPRWTATPIAAQAHRPFQGD